jgi:glycosyltransferase involved in cell wall biosynthesis
MLSPVPDPAAAPPEANERPSVVYVSYDGATEPLGVSQVVAYLERLAADASITLISFEKPGDETGPMAARLRSAGIDWVPLRYHRSPPVVATAFDVLKGARAIRAAVGSDGNTTVHARSYVPALMALRSGVLTNGKLLFDIRGFWADERVEGGLWKRGGFLYRLAKRQERRFFAAADAVVTLTRASIPQIREWLPKSREVPIVVIPTCTDVDRYADTEPRPSGRMAVWSGSIGTWYRFGVGVKLAEALGLPLKVLTREIELANSEPGTSGAEIKEVEPAGVAAELSPGDVGLCLVRPSFSKLASAPTRVAEHLAAGNYVAVLSGVGDLDELIRTERVGVVLPSESAESVDAAARDLGDLFTDIDGPARCRAAARRHFSLDEGVRRYSALYSRLAGSD